MKRIFVEPKKFPYDDTFHTLDPKTAHYIRDVLRLESGNQLELIDGNGELSVATLMNVESNQVSIRIDNQTQTESAESPCRITLYQAIPKGDRWRWLLEKSTELGVRRIVPLKSDRTVVDVPDSKKEKKLTRWRRVAGEATRQSQRTISPQIAPQTTLKQALHESTESPQLIATTRQQSRSLLDVLSNHLQPLPKHPAIGLWIGPEGGFTDSELHSLKNLGETVALGPRILRTETAAVAALSLIQSVLGDLN